MDIWKSGKNPNCLGDDYIPPDKRILYRNMSPKKFRFNGNVWHHIKNNVPEHSIMDRHGSWIKTDMNTFKNVFRKEVAIKVDNISERDFPCSYDDLEIFIDEKI